MNFPDIMRQRLAGVDQDPESRLRALQAWYGEVSAQEDEARLELAAAQSEQVAADINAVVAGKAVAPSADFAAMERKADALASLAVHIGREANRLQNDPQRIASLHRAFGRLRDELSRRVWDRQAKALRLILPLLDTFNGEPGAKADGFLAFMEKLNLPIPETAELSMAENALRAELPEVATRHQNNGAPGLHTVIPKDMVLAIIEAEGHAAPAKPDHEAALSDARARRAARLAGKAPGAAA